MLLTGQLDCAVAAATSKKWIEAKMRELCVTTNPDYKLCMLLDDLAMITVDTPTYGVIEVRMIILLIDGLKISSMHFYCSTSKTIEIIIYFCKQLAWSKYNISSKVATLWQSTHAYIIVDKSLITVSYTHLTLPTIYSV